MRSRYTAALAALLGLTCGAFAQFTPTTKPVLDGLRATADLPASQQHRNVGGSDGAGLCVYTSAWHASIWQDVRDLSTFRAWMERRPGGSYPQKFDSTISQYCKEKGVPVPPYVQHTGGDDDFLRLALRTGRMPCITYCGVDGPGSYGNQVIAHMVNLVYLDDTHAAILDNNFPGRWLWMSANDFLCRWRGTQANGRSYTVGRQPVGGGWAIVFLADPPAPYPDAPPVTTDKVSCPCEDCKCAQGSCPNTCPVSYGQCANGKCQMPAPVYVPPVTPSATTPAPIGAAPSDRHEWGWIEGAGYGWRFKRATEAAPLAPAVAAPVGQFPPDGVDSVKLLPETTYSHTGRKIDKAQAWAALELSDDSGRWNLSAVGDGVFVAKVKADVAAMPPDLRGKLHVQAYDPSAWQVIQFKLVTGLTLRKPSANRVGADVGVIPVADYTPSKLASLMTVPGGPTPAPVAPVPVPVPTPVKPADPTPTPIPVPNPMPAPVPAPSSPTSPLLAMVLAGIALLVSLFKKKVV